MPFENHFKIGIKEFRFVNWCHPTYYLAEASKPCSSCYILPLLLLNAHFNVFKFQTTLESNDENC